MNEIDGCEVTNDPSTFTPLSSMPATRMVLARALSIVGHPVVLVFAAALITASARGASFSQLRFIGEVSALIAGVGLALSWIQVRRGRWAHIDASAKSERASLNIVLVVLLWGSAAAVWLGGKPLPMVIALALAGGLVVIALLTARWLKISLHAMFAAFSTALVWPVIPAVAIGVSMTLGVMWSRLVLQRHVLAEVLVGLLAGTGAGVTFQVWMSRL